MSSIKVILLVFLATTSCRKNNRPESEAKVNNSKSGFAALCQRLLLGNTGRSMWPGIGTTVGGISAQNAAQKPTLRKRHSRYRTVFKGTEIQALLALTIQRKARKHSLAFLVSRRLNDAFKKAVADLKTELILAWSK